MRKNRVELSDEAMMAALKIGKTNAGAAKVLDCDPTTICKRKGRYMAFHGIDEEQFNFLVKNTVIDQSLIKPNIPSRPSKKSIFIGQIIKKGDKKYVIKETLGTEGHVRAAKMSRGLIFWRTPEYLEPDEYEVTSERVSRIPRQERTVYDEAGIMSDTNNYLCT